MSGKFIFTCESHKQINEMFSSNVHFTLKGDVVLSAFACFLKIVETDFT